jgi:hypothetical protein
MHWSPKNLILEFVEADKKSFEEWLKSDGPDYVRKDRNPCDLYVTSSGTGFRCGEFAVIHGDKCYIHPSLKSP